MANKKAENQEEMLIDIHGKDIKPCIPIARKYYTAIRKRLADQKEEAELLEELAATIRAANLKPLEDGLIHFKREGVDILLTPGKDKVKVVIDD